MNKTLLWIAAACALAWMGGCANPYAGERFSSLRSDPAGWIVLQSLERQGYLDWASEDGLQFDLRTRELSEDRETILVETLCIAAGRPAAASQGTSGSSFVTRFFEDGAYRETRDQELVTDPALIEAGRARLLHDLYFTQLPFLLAGGSAEMKQLASVTLEGIRYDVVEVRIPEVAGFPPDPWYRLYFSHALHLLEKVFFPAGEGPLKGKYVWCDLDNYDEYEGTVIPLHRTFTEAVDEQGARVPRPFLEQWLYKLEFGYVPEPAE